MIALRFAQIRVVTEIQLRAVLLAIQHDVVDGAPQPLRTGSLSVASFEQDPLDPFERRHMARIPKRLLA